MILDINIIRDLSKEYSYHLTKLMKNKPNTIRLFIKDQFSRIINLRRDNLYQIPNLVRYSVITLHGLNLQIYAKTSYITSQNLSTLLTSSLFEHNLSVLLNFHICNMYFIMLSRVNLIKIIFEKIKIIVKLLRILFVLAPGTIESIIEYKTNILSNDWNLFFVITLFTIGSTIILPIIIPRLYQRNQISKILKKLIKELTI